LELPDCPEPDQTGPESVVLKGTNPVSQFQFTRTSGYWFNSGSRLHIDHPNRTDIFIKYFFEKVFFCWLHSALYLSIHLIYLFIYSIMESDYYALVNDNCLCLSALFKDRLTPPAKNDSLLFYVKITQMLNFYLQHRCLQVVV